MNHCVRTFSKPIVFIIALGCAPLAHLALAQQPPAAAAARAGAPAAAGGETGLAAVYSDRLHGRKTASGERYDRAQLTAAHKTLPFGTRLKVTNTKNQKSVTVRINDRGPTQAGRILDLSPAAARALGIRPKGMGEVSTEVVGEAPKRNKG
jgi:rare lipoprotein A